MVTLRTVDKLLDLMSGVFPHTDRKRRSRLMRPLMLSALVMFVPLTACSPARICTLKGAADHLSVELPGELLNPTAQYRINWCVGAECGFDPAFSGGLNVFSSSMYQRVTVDGPREITFVVMDERDHEVFRGRTSAALREAVDFEANGANCPTPYLTLSLRAVGTGELVAL